MDIYILDLNPVACAQAYFDKHIVKMIHNIEQVRANAHHFHSCPKAKYMIPEKNPENRFSMWACSSARNYNWLSNLFDACCQEWRKRFDPEPPAVHPSEPRLVRANHPPLGTSAILFTRPPVASSEFRSPAEGEAFLSAVELSDPTDWQPIIDANRTEYRRLYANRSWADWEKGTSVPSWILE